MIGVLFYIILSTVFVSLVSLIGIALFLVKSIDKWLLLLVGFSAGTLIGAAFLHLLPEAIEEGQSISLVMLFLVIGICVFFLIEKILHWHHCHKTHCDINALSYMNLVGDGVHNFIDGTIIAGSYLVSVPFGVVTTIVIVLHEIPQEIGDFAVIVYGGFSKVKALWYNLFSALLSVIGGIATYVFSRFVSGFLSYLTAFAAGGFIYIAASDLIPEMHKEKQIKRSWVSYLFFIAGILFIFIFGFLFVE